MMLESLIGNDLIKKRLSHLLQTEAIPQLLLFSGRAGVGKSAFARAFASAVLQKYSHSALSKIQRRADILSFSPQGKLGTHLIDEMREFCRQVHSTPFFSDKKICIIDQADCLPFVAGNALLKTLEEPPPHAIIILITSSLEKVLLTIRSRSFVMRFSPIPQELIARNLPVEEGSRISTQEAFSIARLSEGSLQESQLFSHPLYHQFQQTLFSFLSEGREWYYVPTEELVSRYETLLQQQRKEWEEEMKKSFLVTATSTLQQREESKKRGEALLFFQMRQHINGLMKSVLFWYRDLHFLDLFGGRECDQKLLLLPSRYPQLMQRREALSSHPLVPLYIIEESIQKVHQGLNRAMQVSCCLEYFFLSITSHNH